ncbi:MAG TPA: polymer-forming cytoskeletal protein [Phycisphaerae bacterium]|nr:polymer-forming cytoskeletal protein [Phycisphaerae bacterium]
MSEVVSSGIEKTVINAQTVIKGEITFAGPAVVCGRIEGQIRAQDELQITAGGSVEGDIIGAVVDIQGTVKGNVTASQTTRLGANAKLIGELRAANLAISEGATFVGKVCVGEVPAPAKMETRTVTAHSPRAVTQTIAPAPAAIDPAAALQSRLASMQESAEENEDGDAGSIRIVPAAIHNLKRVQAAVQAAH